MTKLLAFLLAVTPLVVAQILNLSWMFVILVAALGIASALLTLVSPQDEKSAFLILLATLTTAISFSVPVLGIGNHFPISTGSLMAQTLLWIPAVTAILIVHPGSLQTLRHGPQRWLAGLLIIGLIVSPLMSDPVATVVATMNMLAITFVAAAAQYYLGSPETFRSMAIGIAGFVFMSVLFANPLTEWNWAISDTESTAWGLPRVSGFAAEPMHLSLLAGLSAVLALSTVQRSGNMLRLTLLGAMAVSGVGVVLGQGRMPIIALVISTLWFLIRTGSTKTRVWLVSLTTVALIVVIITSPTQVLRRDGSDENLSSLNGRNAIWPVAIDAIQEQPLLGYGAAGSETVFTQAIEDTDLPPASVRNSHNRVLETWIMFGLLGIVLTGFALAQALGGLFKGGAAESEAVLVYLAVSGLTTPGSGSAFVDPLLMAFVVALAGLATRSSDFNTLRVKPDRTLREGPARPPQPGNLAPHS